MSIKSLLFHTATWYQANRTQDATANEFISSYTSAGSVKCNIQPLKAGQVAFYFERGIEVDTSIYVLPGQDFKLNDRLTYNGTDYVIKGFRDMISLSRLVELNCKSYPSEAKKE